MSSFNGILSDDKIDENITNWPTTFSDVWKEFRLTLERSINELSTTK